MSKFSDKLPESIMEVSNNSSNTTHSNTSGGHTTLLGSKTSPGRSISHRVRDLVGPILTSQPVLHQLQASSHFDLHIESSIPVFNFPAIYPLFGDRLSHFYSAWETITRDK